MSPNHNTPDPYSDSNDSGTLAASPPPCTAPALHAWIVAQAQAGHSAAAMLAAMLERGWAQEAAAQALKHTLEQHLTQALTTTVTTAIALPETTPSTAPAAVLVPEPNLTGSPSILRTQDHDITVLMHMTHPRIVVMGHVLTDQECDALIAAAQPRMARSLTVATDTGGEMVNQDRTSEGMFFERGENDLIERIERRIAQLLNWPVSHGEGLQVLHYPPGAQYKPHYDYFDPQQAGTPSLLARGGQRVGTLLLYLNTPEQGGSTIFPDLMNMNITAQRGYGVFFSYPQPHPNTRTLHGGAPVISGDKWIATKWLRERPFA